MITNRELIEKCRKYGYYCDNYCNGCILKTVCETFQRANSLLFPYEVGKVLYAQELSGIDFRDKNWIEEKVPGKTITNRDLITKCIGTNTNCEQCDRVSECDNFRRATQLEPWEVGNLLLSDCRFSDAWLDGEVEE